MSSCARDAAIVSRPTLRRQILSSVIFQQIIACMSFCIVHVLKKKLILQHSLLDCVWQNIAHNGVSLKPLVHRMWMSSVSAILTDHRHNISPVSIMLSFSLGSPLSIVIAKLWPLATDLRISARQ